MKNLFLENIIMYSYVISITTHVNEPLAIQDEK